MGYGRDQTAAFFLLLLSLASIFGVFLWASLGLFFDFGRVFSECLN
jgi:hypothetical protein